MTNAETQATLDTRRRTNINKTKQKTEIYKGQQHGPYQKLGVHLGALEGEAVPVSYKTPSTVLFIVKSG